MPPIRIAFTTAMVCLALNLSGCGGSAPPASTAKSPPPVETPAANPEKVAPTEPAPADTKMTTSQFPAIQQWNWDELQEQLAKHSGKVVVIDLWSTSCEPCLREFPHLVALRDRFPDDVVCISFDCDFTGAKNKPVGFYTERVSKFLTSQGADKLINVMSTVAADELFVKLDLDSIPAAYVYDRSGKLAKRFDNRTPASATEEGISYETQIAPLVAELVKAAKN